MSDTESFESVMEAAMPLLSGDCVFESCPDENDDCMHCAIHMADRLRRAYDREIRDTAQQQYHRGFEAGRHSMDAEHRAVAMRLRGLRFDGGSHENLSRIAYAIYPCATGWTCESAAGLRDRLIDLMGGVSDELSEPLKTINLNNEYDHFLKTGDGDDTCGCAGGGACAADCGRDSGEQEEVSDGRVADDCGGDTGGSYRGVPIHLDGLTAYDVLWNERRKAIAELRKLNSENFGCGQFMGDLLSAIDPNWINRASTFDEATLNEYMRDRLIHLLGGDQPSGIDVLREMDAESDDDGTSHNDDHTPSIAYELQEKLDKLYRHESTKSGVNGLIVGTYTKAEAIKRIERIYGGD